jgi:predicted nucleic-acid-binding protein
VIAIDTNVLVRLLVGDDEAQLARARSLIERCVETGDGCFITTPVLCELEWVLESVYHASRADVAGAVQALLSTPPFETENAEVTLQALRQYSKGRADFSDYLLGYVGRSRGARTTYTFDRGLRGAEGFTLL